MVSALSLVGMIVSFFIQTAIAKHFGATDELDAFLAASTFPQYVVAVLTGSLGVVFIPIFIDHLNGKADGAAWEVASSVFNLTSLFLLLVVALGILFADPIVRMAFPGLSPEAISLTVYMTRILWPSIIFSGWISLISGIYQAHESFLWPALVSALGLAATLFLFLILRVSLGIEALAWSTLIAAGLQAALLLPIFLRAGRFELSWKWLPGVRQTWLLLWPLFLSGFFIRATSIVDRYVASSLPAGSISHLGYASKILALASVLISTGLATVLFPRMASSASLRDMGQLKNTVSNALRMIWLVVSPITAWLVLLSVPLVTVLLERGAFHREDSLAVGVLLAWYAISLTGTSVGAITGRVFYVLQDTRTPSIMGVLEMLAYLMYTPLLAAWYGTIGVAVAYGIYFTASVAWHAYYIWSALGRSRPVRLWRSFLEILLATAISSCVVWWAASRTSEPWMQVLLAGISGFCSYILLLKLMGSRELEMLIEGSGVRILMKRIGSA